MIAAAVYLLCAVTCAICAALLLRSYRRSGFRLLFWSGAGFLVFTVGNVLLFVDLALLPNVDLSLIRDGTSAVVVALLICGLVWEG